MDDLLTYVYGSRSERKPVKSEREAPLPQFRLEADSERAALRQLKLSWGGKKEQQHFERLVLAQLAQIADMVQLGRRPRLGTGQKRSEAIRTLTRRATKVRNFAESLRRPLNLPFFSAACPPVTELLKYAEALESEANRIKRLGDGVAVSIIWRPSRPRRKPRPESRAVVDLIRFVRKHTHAAHWDHLAALLKRPLGGGLTIDCLRALEKAHPPWGVFKRAVFGRAVFARADAPRKRPFHWPSTPSGG
jgi:hypothetical protein